MLRGSRNVKKKCQLYPYELIFGLIWHKGTFGKEKIDQNCLFFPYSNSDILQQDEFKPKTQKKCKLLIKFY